MAPEPSHGEVTEVTEEGNLLIEAVTLVVQRQRETESWVSGHIWQADERAVATEQRYAELEARVAGIEAHLSRLVRELEPARADAAGDGRLERLRAQIEGLKSGGDGCPPRGAPATGVANVQAPVAVAAEAALRQPEVAARPVAVNESSPNEQRQVVAPAAAVSESSPEDRRQVVAPAAAGHSSRSRAGVWDLVGATPQERAGAVLMCVGAVAVLYAILTQVRFG